MRLLTRQRFTDWHTQLSTARKAQNESITYTLNKQHTFIKLSIEDSHSGEVTPR